MDIKKDIFVYLDDLIDRYPQLECCREDIISAYNLIKKCYIEEGKLLIAGNGGSAADAEHMVGELMKGFLLKRKLNKEDTDNLKRVDDKMGEILSGSLQNALPAIALDGHVALSTAYMNDCLPELCFAQQVFGYGNNQDVYLGISTSGNSKNVIYAAVVAKSKKMKVIGLTGENKSKLSSIADVCIKVPETETYKIQELHLPIYHCICMMLESFFFS